MCRLRAAVRPHVSTHRPPHGGVEADTVHEAGGGQSSANPEIDVLIVGAGLVGLALAAALARSGLSTALTDRRPIATPEPPTCEDDWDNRVYAISPGSATFLRAIGAWHRLPCERVA